MKSKLKNIRHRNPELQTKRFKVDEVQLARVGLPDYDSVLPATEEETKAAYKLRNASGLQEEETRHLERRRQLRALLDAMKAPSIIRMGHITMAGGMLHCEGEVVAEYDGAFPGFLVWAVAHTVFAQRATGNANVVLQFIQRTCLDVKEALSPS